MSTALPSPPRVEVLLSEAGSTRGLAEYAAAADLCVADPSRALALAVLLGNEVNLAATGVRSRWELLATLAARDLTVARCAATHLGALAVLEDLDAEQPGVREAILADVDAETVSTWAVWTASAKGRGLGARQQGDGWVLEGVQPWCTLAGLVSHALVSAHVGRGVHALFAVALDAPGVVVPPTMWSGGESHVVSGGDVEFHSVSAVPVGPPGWAAVRTGADIDRIDAAACWYGAAVALARTLGVAEPEASLRQAPRHHLGAVDADLHTARLALDHAACEVESGRARLDTARLLALRTRVVVARNLERSLAYAESPRALELAVAIGEDGVDKDLAALGRLTAPGSYAP